MHRFIIAFASLFFSAAAYASDTESSAPGSPRELARELRKDWDLLGVEVDATSSHTLASIGPRYQLVTRPGLYIDASAEVGFTVRDAGPPAFGQAHAVVGWSLIRGMKNKDTLFNIGQESTSDMQWSYSTYEYLETQVVAQRNVILYGGARTIIGRGPDLADGTVAPGYVSLSGGLAFLTTWREIQEFKGERRMMRGVQGFELIALYAPAESASEGFGKFEHFGGELRIHKTLELGKLAAPFHGGLGIEPGLGPMVRLGMLWPVMSPIAGKYGHAKTGEFR